MLPGPAFGCSLFSALLPSTAFLRQLIAIQAACSALNATGYQSVAGIGVGVPLTGSHHSNPCLNGLWVRILVTQLFYLIVLLFNWLIVSFCLFICFLFEDQIPLIA